MDQGVRLAKSYNVFLMLLLVSQIAVLIGIIIIALTSFGAGGIMPLVTAVSVVSLVLLCVPMAILQYLAARDRMLKILFGGLTGVFFISSIVVLVWYAAAEYPALLWLPDLARFLTLVCYVPMILSLLAVSKAEDLKIEPHSKASLVLIAVVSAMVVVFFSLGKAGSAGVDLFGTFNYTSAVILDIVVLTLTSFLILTHLSNKLRYLLSIILTMFLLSTVADLLMLVDCLALSETLELANLGYALMINFAGVALVAYSLGHVKVVTVEEVYRKLEDANMLMSDMVEQSPLAICMCDTAGTILTANDRFLDICGKSPSDILGRLDLSQALPESGQVLKPGTKPGAITEAITVDGLKIDRAGKASAYFRLTLFPTHGADGKVNNLVVILDDITDRKAFEDQLVSAKKQTDLYVDLMGHDVNNMNQIALGFLELAEDRIREEGQLREDDLFLISKPIEALVNNSRLIYSIRKLQQEKAGAYGHEPVDVGQVLASVTSQYSRIAGRDVRVTLNVEENCTVMANELLGDVFGNLVGNAVKHSKGPVRICIDMTKTTVDGGEYCKVSVEDDGPGISDELKGRLFDRLSINGPRAKGSGFGLCLSRILVEGFGGRLDVEDRVPGDYTKGVKFVVVLPIADPGLPGKPIEPGVQERIGSTSRAS